MSEPLRILALETVDQRGSLAALTGDELLAHVALDPAQRSAQSLAPGIAELLREVGWTVRDPQLVAVTVGPGSFTGLRVGVTTAKTLAYVTGAAVLGISSLEAIAMGVPPSTVPPNAGRLWTLLDAQRQELFAASYRWQAENWREEFAPAVLSVSDWREQLQPGDAVCGPPLAKLAESLPDGVTVIEAAHWAPTAVGVGRLAWQKYLAGEGHDLWRLLPVYLRKSAAEEQWERRESPRATDT